MRITCSFSEKIGGLGTCLFAMGKSQAYAVVGKMAERRRNVHRGAAADIRIMGSDRTKSRNLVYEEFVEEVVNGHLDRSVLPCADVPISVAIIGEDENLLACIVNAVAGALVDAAVPIYTLFSAVGIVCGKHLLRAAEPSAQLHSALVYSLSLGDAQPSFEFDNAQLEASAQMPGVSDDWRAVAQTIASEMRRACEKMFGRAV